MGISDLKIRVAIAADGKIVSEILIEAAKWLENRGIPSWNPSDLTVEEISEDIAAGKYYLAMSGTDPVGCFRFQETDEEYWGDVPHSDSNFVHRVAVRRKYAGMGVPTQILNFAKQKAFKNGKSFLKLDCIDRKGLRAVYEREGFVFHSIKKRSPYDVVRYEVNVEAGSVNSRK